MSITVAEANENIEWHIVQCNMSKNRYYTKAQNHFFASDWVDESFQQFQHRDGDNNTVTPPIVKMKELTKNLNNWIFYGTNPANSNRSWDILIYGDHQSCHNWLMSRIGDIERLFCYPQKCRLIDEWQMQKMMRISLILSEFNA